MIKMKHKCAFWYLFILYDLSQSSTENLKQIHVLFRHGARAPTETYPNDPYINHKWSGGWGQLTIEGKRQMYALGQNLRAYYESFVPYYYWHESVNFTSSYADRCLMSAELVGAGMFPPKDEQIWNEHLLWQPIPIHYLPRSLDNFIAMKRLCKNYDQAFSNVMKSPKVTAINDEYKNLYEYLSERTGMPVDNIGVVESLYNTLEIEQRNNLALPSWVNETIMARMRVLAAQNLALYSETEYMKRMKAGVFLRTVIDLMQNIMGGIKVPSINMYSGHDLTIVQIMRALNLTDTIKPDYGASLIFEVHSDKQVKVLYQENWEKSPEEQTLEFCQNPCDLDSFEQSLRLLLPDDWEKECNEKLQF